MQASSSVSAQPDVARDLGLFLKQVLGSSSREFFAALHETGCASARAGWLPQFVTLWDGKRLKGALPLYLKSHSYGEYVFDWAWADAYQRHGLEYYPKLLAAVPFSPVTGRAPPCRSARRNLAWMS